MEEALLVLPNTTAAPVGTYTTVIKRITKQLPDALESCHAIVKRETTLLPLHQIPKAPHPQKLPPSAHIALCRRDGTEHHSVIHDGNNDKITAAKGCQVAVTPIKRRSQNH